MRIPFLAAATILLLPGASEELVYAPAEGLVLVRTFDASYDYSLDERHIELDGEEFPHDAPPELQILSEEHIVVTDELQGVEGGRPTRLQRTFDELERNVTQSTPGAEDAEQHSLCDLEGSSVVFRWNEDEQAYDVEAAEGEELDEDVLDDLLEDMDLRQILPDKEVEPGDEWEVDVDAYARLMWPGGFLHFYEEGGEFDAEGVQGDRELVENLEGKGKAVFQSLRDEDGVQVAVLHVRFEVTSSSTRTVPGPAESEAERTLSLTREIEGTLLWAVEAGHLASAELSAEAELEVSETGTIETPSGDKELRQTSTFSGTIDYRVTIEKKD